MDWTRDRVSLEQLGENSFFVSGEIPFDKVRVIHLL